jgi:hypothetical protein
MTDIKKVAASYPFENPRGTSYTFSASQLAISGTTNRPNPPTAGVNQKSTSSTLSDSLTLQVTHLLKAPIEILMAAWAMK